MSKILRNLSAMALAALLSGAATAGAAESQVALDGYYRISSASNGMFAQVTGPFTVKPDQSLSQAISEPGSVFYIKAVADKDSKGNNAFRIVSLRSQGIEVVARPDGFSYLDIESALIGSPDNMAHALAHLGASKGYMNVARGAVEYIIYFMGCYLDANYKIAGVEGVDPDVDLVAITENFIEVVAENLNLNFYLQPDASSKTYRVYMDIPDMQPVVDWYKANPDFNTGLAAMRYGMTLRGIPTGEYFSQSEIDEMAATGYVLPERYKQDINPETGQFHVPYEQVFADADLLFAWLKLYGSKLLDPERCPDVTLHGISLRDVGRALRQHRLTAKLINYIPRLEPGKRVYLINGMMSAGGVEGTLGTDYTDNGEFGYIEPSQLAAAGSRASWLVTPVNTTDNSFALNFIGNNYTFDAITENITDGDDATIAEQTKRQSESGYYTTLYLDFPVRVDGSMKLYTLTNEAAAHDKDGQIFDGTDYGYNAPVKPRTITPEGGSQMYYYELVEAGVTEVPMHTAYIAVATQQGNAPLEINYPTKEPEYSFYMSVGDDEVVSGQKSPARAPEGQGDNLLKGTLLPVSAANLPAYGFGNEYDADQRPAYSLSIADNVSNKRRFSLNDGTIGANSAFLLHPLGDDLPSGDYSNIYIGLPQKETVSGVDNIAVDSEAADSAIYDIYGRKVSEMIPGNIYIVNGCKTIAK